MPSLTLLIASLLLSHLTTRGRATDSTLSYTISNNDDLQKHCSFDLNGSMYDICPLVGLTRVVQVPEETMPDLGGRYYYVVALGGLGDGDELVKLPGCGEGTWVCLTTTHEHRFRAIPAIRKGRSSNLTLIAKSITNLDHDRLQITLLGASKDLEIQFTCSELEKVELIDVRDSGLRLMWASRHGCPRLGTSKSALNAWTDGEQPPDGDSNPEPEGDDELLPSESRRARTGIALVVVFIVLSVIGGSALASSARARHLFITHLQSASYAIVPILSQVRFKLQPLGHSLHSLTSKPTSTSGRFRPGDERLVRWAQEDMALDSDVMVNGGAYDYHDDDAERGWDGSGEYIPLATSPRRGWGVRMQSYGSTVAPEVPTSQERGAMSRIRRYLKI